MAFKIADRFKQDPDKYLRMPFAKLLLYSRGLQVLDGEILIERILDEDDEKIMNYINDNKDNLISELGDILNEADNNDEYVGGLTNK